jgi:hypothetical protein
MDDGKWILARANNQSRGEPRLPGSSMPASRPDPVAYIHQPRFEGEAPRRCG